MIDLLPSRVTRAFGSEVAYAETLSNVHKFNSRFLRERRIRLRLPFVDSQTHIIQSPTQDHLWRKPNQRLPLNREDQVASYPRHTWHKKRINQPTLTLNSSKPASESVPEDGTTIIKDTSDEKQTIMEDDPRILVRAGELGKSCL